MLNLLQSIFRSSPGPSGPGEDLIRAAIERVIDGTEPRLRAFFVSNTHLQEVVSYSEDLQKYLQSASTSPMGTIHCLLTLDRSQKGVLGMALRGAAVSHDVAQVVVNFSNHRLVWFAED